MSSAMAAAYGSCADDMKTPTKVLNIISLILSAGAFTYKLQRAQSRRFPANLAMLTCGYSVLLAATMVLDSIRDQSTPTSHGSVATCRVLGLAYQFFASLVVWNWILTIVVLYMVLGRQLPYSVVGSYDSMYYCLLSCVPSILLALGLSRNAFGFNAETKTCWIARPRHAFMLFYAQLLFGLVVFLAMVPSLVRRLRSHPELYAPFANCVYTALTATVLLLYGVNLVLMDNNPTNAYVHATMATYCGLHGIDLSLFGAVSALLHLWPSYSDLAPGSDEKPWPHDEPETVDESQRPQMARTPSHHSLPESRHSLASSQPSSAAKSKASSRPGSHAILRSYVMPAVSPVAALDTRPHNHPDLCQSAFDSACGTAVSVPPDFQVRLVQQEATVAYTNLMLGYVRDQLMAEGFDMSSREMSTFLSTLTRSVLASSRSMASTNPNTLDVRLVQAMERYRREQQNSTELSLTSTSTSQYNTASSSKKSVHFKDLDLDARLAMARERYAREQTFIMGNTELSTSSVESSPRSSIGNDLDARLAAARMRYLNDDDDNDDDDDLDSLYEGDSDDEHSAATS
ncbi:hypothetical protein SPRG_20247 [Saprolegnia parasitica CBS 223.65]|uniref:Uncharacterized protein n=1 Tax=Saprolegnia parasitica (strain CBS 223.65) TaxID=695850 RepID=A0A067CBF0_SAPPC|nr:hypothetical protein SPRG_20247 [Saprolegnia parasitica CBS 223.65]KDO28089.1 hypothetical protein SPRG_20247 [Saprolegnia parasitica CBS 223.65]|eukprot:XP_012201233.1 hypothetical protein SPRG_20247 [Saprolegnia parasitica CBS 223.65]